MSSFGAQEKRSARALVGRCNVESARRDGAGHGAADGRWATARPASARQGPEIDWRAEVTEAPPNLPGPEASVPPAWPRPTFSTSLAKKDKQRTAP